jgi:hypothetical protein
LLQSSRVLHQLIIERPEEFSPGLDPELQALVDALTEYKETTAKKAARKKSNSLPGLSFVFFYAIL